MLGDPQHGRWLIAPIAGAPRIARHYRGDTLILETTFETDTGSACVIDFMSRREGVSDLVRIVRGVSGTVAMHTELIVRFGHGSVMPWVSRGDYRRLEFTAGPDRLLLDTTVSLSGVDFRTVGEFNIREKDEACFTLSRALSYGPIPAPFHAIDTLAEVSDFWSNWAKQFDATGEWSAAVLRSLLTLKALSHRDTGGIVAAGTTSLPEKIGGAWNWDYRFCWLRDATFTLYALLGAGFLAEARAWRQWLLRAIAGSPDDLQIMYGIGGERRLEECYRA